MVNEGRKARVSTSARRGPVSRGTRMMTRQNVRKIPRPLGRVMVRFTIMDSDGLSGATDESVGKATPPGPAYPRQGGGHTERRQRTAMLRLIGVSAERWSLSVLEPGNIQTSALARPSPRELLRETVRIPDTRAPAPP